MIEKMLNDENMRGVVADDVHHDLIRKHFSHLMVPTAKPSTKEDKSLIPLEAVKSQGKRLIGPGQLKTGEIYGFTTEDGKYRIFQMPSPNHSLMNLSAIDIETDYMDVGKEGLNGQVIQNDSFSISRNTNFKEGVYHFEAGTSVREAYLSKVE